MYLLSVIFGMLLGVGMRSVHAKERKSQRDMAFRLFRKEKIMQTVNI